MKLISLIALTVLVVSASASAKDCQIFEKAVSRGSESQKLKTFLDVQWKYLMTEYPEYASWVGYPGQDDRWSDHSLKRIAREKKMLQCEVNALKKIKAAKLPAKERLNYDLALRRSTLYLESKRFKEDLMPINHLEGFYIEAIQLLNMMPRSSVKAYENILSRLDKFAKIPKDTVEVLREGVKHKVMPVKAFMPFIRQQLTALTPKNVEDSPFFTPFKEMPPAISTEDQERMKKLAKEIISQKIYPSLTEFLSFFDKEYAPRGRENIAWSDLPDGKAWYAHFVKRSTTTNLTPDEIHEIGLREVERLTKEMDNIRKEVKFKGDLKAFNKYLRTDKRFFFKNKEDLIAGYRDIAKRIDPELTKLFKTLPRMPYGIREMPEDYAKTAPGAHYISGSLETGRAGYFEANTYNVFKRPKWEMETLVMHEAVPGHHLQIALAKEMKDLPEFRRNAGFTAYVEGWGLYAETLGKEMGFFKDPYSYYGHLSWQMVRAIRLVVDTGMHAKGWSKEKAVAYFREHTPVAEDEIESEINRYITWPGQALAYKIGKLKFAELREKASNALGEQFDIREFHDQVLLNGALPLDVLEKNIDAWIRQAAKGKPRVDSVSKTL